MKFLHTRPIAQILNFWEDGIAPRTSPCLQFITVYVCETKSSTTMVHSACSANIPVIFFCLWIWRNYVLELTKYFLKSFHFFLTALHKACVANSSSSALKSQALKSHQSHRPMHVVQYWPVIGHDPGSVIASTASENEPQPIFHVWEAAGEWLSKVALNESKFKFFWCMGD